MEEREIIHRWESVPTKKIKLIKQAKGYAWEITYESIDNSDLLAQIEELDNKLRDLYGSRTIEGTD